MTLNWKVKVLVIVNMTCSSSKMKIQISLENKCVELLCLGNLSFRLLPRTLRSQVIFLKFSQDTSFATDQWIYLRSRTGIQYMYRMDEPRMSCFTFLCLILHFKINK